jgi:hypothetical protein
VILTLRTTINAELAELAEKSTVQTLLLRVLRFAGNVVPGRQRRQPGATIEQERSPVEEAIVDAYGESEQRTALFTMLELPSESLRVAKERGSHATLDGEFGRDLETIISSRREPLHPPAWE